ncbi:MAG: hypothetical protein B6D46_13630 [Polyangiaceae bacterium UTPRO1]|jgi:uncharacterized protein (DUF2249 family)|nr:DUF2249 domain-containing protein [Myxococcales bacterium]OQY65740.1 MAG: hypothetical protein B6D46_13630 [Polyangiaceae bacterium UTPRO1]
METAAAIPQELRAAGVTGEKLLDVRPILDAGGDPFSLIMKTVKQLDEKQALHLLVGFEPVPLYEVMSSFGRAALTEQRDGLYHVWFYTKAEQPQRAADASDERAELQAPVELDVRGMEPPGPMIAILQKLVDLGPGAQLLVRHHREPVLLYDKLKLRGYAATCTPQPEGDFLVRIAPAWAFEAEGG